MSWSLWTRGRAKGSARINSITFAKWLFPLILQLKKLRLCDLPKVTQLAALLGLKPHSKAASERQRGGGSSRKRAPGAYLVEGGRDEGQEGQPARRAARDQRHRVMHFIRLHSRLGLGQGRGREGCVRGQTLHFWGFPSQTLYTPWT